MEEENKPRSRFRKRDRDPSQSDSPESRTEKPAISPPASKETSQRQVPTEEDAPLKKETSANSLPKSTQNDLPSNRSTIIEKQAPPSIDLPTNSNNLQSDPVSYNSAKDERDNERDEDDEVDDDEETGLLLRETPKVEEEMNKLPPQDIASQNNRVKWLRDFSDLFPIRLFASCSSCLKAGYDIHPLYRMARFADVNKGVNILKLTDGLNLGVTIKQINTYKEHIIGLVRPFVRVYALNVETGLYSQSADEIPLKPLKTKGNLATHNCSKVAWNEELILDAPFSDLVSESTVLLFEIIDQRSSLSLKRKNSQANQDRYSYKKVAWAYLLPIGIDGRLNVPFYRQQPALPNIPTTNSHPELPRMNSEETHSLNLNLHPAEQDAHNKYVANDQIDNHYKLQLFSYQDYDGFIGLVQRGLLAWPGLNPRMLNAEDSTYPTGVPSIYLQWKLMKRSIIEGAYLDIAIGSRIRKAKEEEKMDDGESGSEGLSPRARQNRKDRGSYAYISTRRKRKLKQRTKEERNRLRTAAMRRHRNPRDICLIPDRFLRRLNVGPDGAMAIAFSHTGHLLAVASKTLNINAPMGKKEVVYSLRLYDPDIDEEVWLDEAAHHGTIYDMKWSRNDRFLLTCSNDGTCKVWDFLALHPVMHQYSAPVDDENFTVLNSPAPEPGNQQPLHPSHHHHHHHHHHHQHQHHAHFASPGQETHHHDEGSVDMSYVANYLNPRTVSRMNPPKVYCVLRLPAKTYAYCGLFQEFPPTSSSQNEQNEYSWTQLLDYNVWKDNIQALQNFHLPRTIIGCSDGKIRVFEINYTFIENPLVGHIAQMTGYISVQDKDENGKVIDIPPHNGTVNSLIIDERSKYLISSDSFGDILAWRLDNKGWYQLLRKFKRDANFQGNPNNNNNPNNGKSAAANASKAALQFYEQQSFAHGSILSLSMHPEKNKGLMLVLSRQPSQLRVINMTTYKTLSYCEGFAGISAYLIHENDEDYSTGLFYRAGYSADGRFIICCVPTNKNGQQKASHNASQVTEKGMFHLMIWDTYTGHPVNTPLSNVTFPYPVRSIAWHPSQHLLAVSMVGPNAAVVLYCTNRESSLETLSMGKVEPAYMNQTTAYPSVVPGRSPVPSVQASVENLNLTGKSDIQYSILDSNNSTLHMQNNNLLSQAAQNAERSMNPIIAAAKPAGRAPVQPPSSALSQSQSTSSDLEDRAARAARAKELLAKIRGNKQAKEEESK